MKFLQKGAEERNSRERVRNEKTIGSERE